MSVLKASLAASKFLKMKNALFFRFLFIAFAIGLLSSRCEAQDTLIEFDRVEGHSSFNADAESVQRWRSMRLGLFIHWGPSADRDLPHSHARRSRFKPSGTVAPDVYDRFYQEFNPTEFDPNAWMKLAKDSGMRYVVFTAKHHDGFSMFDSAVTDYDIMSTPFQKDVCAMLADACHKAGLRLGWYYSPRDWYHPAFDTDNHDEYNQFYEAQMQELASNYGPLCVLWFDGIGPTGADKWKDTPRRVAELLRELHPQVMLNARGGMPGDFENAEKRVAPFNRSYPWETCDTITRYGWIYRSEEMATKSFSELLTDLVYSVGSDGNYLLNIGPRADGTIDPKHAERMLEIGAWLEENGEAIYGTRGGPWMPAPWGVSTCKDKTIYLLINNSHSQGISLPLQNVRVLGHRLLNGGDAEVQQGDTEIVVKVLEDSDSREFTAVAIEIDQPAFDLPVLPGQASLADGCVVTASSVKDDNTQEYGPEQVIDGNPETYWEAKPANKDCWIEIEFDKPEWVGKAMLAQLPSWCPLKSCKLQYQKDGVWKTAYKGNSSFLGKPPVIVFEPFYSSRLRVEITKAASRLNLCDLKLFPPDNVAGESNRRD